MDKEIYTKEGLAAIIKHARLLRQIMVDEEARLLMLYEAALHFGTPVDARGRSWTEKKWKYKVPDFAPLYIQQALRAGETVTLPGYRD